MYMISTVAVILFAGVACLVFERVVLAMAKLLCRFLDLDSTALTGAMLSAGFIVFGFFFGLGALR